MAARRAAATVAAAAQRPQAPRAAQAAVGRMGAIAPIEKSSDKPDQKPFENPANAPGSRTRRSKRRAVVMLQPAFVQPQPSPHQLAAAATTTLNSTKTTNPNETNESPKSNGRVRLQPTASPADSHSNSHLNSNLRPPGQASPVNDTNHQTNIKDEPDDLEWFSDLVDSPDAVTETLPSAFASFDDALAKSPLPPCGPVSSSPSAPITQTMTPPDPPIPLISMLRCINDPSDALQSLRQDTAWAMFVFLRAHAMTPSLTTSDWHRLLARIVGRQPFHKKDHRRPLPNEPLRAALIVREMKRCGVAPDAFVYTCLYRVARGKLSTLRMVHRQVIQHLDRIQSSALKSQTTSAAFSFNPISSSTYSTNRDLNPSSFSLHVKSSVSPHLTTITKEFPISNKSIRMLLATLLRTIKSPKKALPLIYSLWDTVIGTPLVMTIDTYLAFLEAFALDRNKTKIESIHALITSRMNRMQQQQQEQKPNTLEPTRDASDSKSGQTPSQSSPWTYRIIDALMKSHMDMGNHRAVRRLMETLVKQNITPRLNTFRMVFRAFEALDDTAGVLRADRWMTKYRVPHDAMTYSVLARRIVNIQSVDAEGKLRAAERLHSRMDTQIRASWPVDCINKVDSVTTNSSDSAGIDANKDDKASTIEQETGKDSVAVSIREPLIPQPLSSTAFIPLIEVYVALGAPQSALDRAVARMTAAHRIETAWNNHNLGIPMHIVTSPSPTMAFLAHCRPSHALRWKMPTPYNDTDTQKDDILDSLTSSFSLIRKYRPPELSRAVVSAIVSRIAATHNADAVTAFFQSHVLTRERLGLLWARQLIGFGSRLRALAVTTQRDMDIMCEHQKTEWHRRHAELNHIRKRIVRKDWRRQGDDNHHASGHGSQPTRTDNDQSDGVVTSTSDHRNQRHARGRKSLQKLHALRRKYAAMHRAEDNRAIKALRATLAWVSRRRRRGVPLSVGRDGPLRVVYEALERVWRYGDVDMSVIGVVNPVPVLDPKQQEPAAQSVDNGGDDNETVEATRLLQLETLLDRLHTLELNVVKSLRFTGLRRVRRPPTDAPAATSTTASIKDEFDGDALVDGNQDVHNDNSDIDDDDTMDDDDEDSNQ